MPTLFCLVILFLIWFTYERKKNDTDFSKSDAFWKREREASYVPKQSTDDISYIEIPEDVIPNILDTDSEELQAAIKAIRRLRNSKICDLSEYSNTDLRLKYGTANFNDLSAADNNYTKLVQYSGKLLTYLSEAGRANEAANYLEFCKTNSIRSGMIDRAAIIATDSDRSDAPASDGTAD
ncbi:MAG: hypothetical protein K6G81_08140 [Lachnospiraceae bacterium]|nr:hypothetical protein [Lachnospiraceae bacterium]